MQYWLNQINVEIKLINSEIDQIYEDLCHPTYNLAESINDLFERFEDLLVASEKSPYRGGTRDSKTFSDFLLSLAELQKRVNALRKVTTNAHRIAHRASAREQITAKSLLEVALNGGYIRGVITVRDQEITLKVILPYYHLWSRIAPFLAREEVANFLSRHPNNLLAILCEPDDVKFVKRVKQDGLNSNELSMLTMARLYHILQNSYCRKLQFSAAILLKKHSELSYSPKDELFRCDWQVLEQELFKAALHAELNPDRKIAWIGTARSVKAIIKENQGQGIYLNCEENSWNWCLNRAWLHAIVLMGYDIHLVEQHFPNIEAAILSEKPERLLAELIQEIRPEEIESQYSGGDSPTATPQESLFLLDMGCVPEKLDNGRLILKKPVAITDELVFSQNQVHCTLTRQHDYPGFFKAAPPPLNKDAILENFEAPEESIVIRSKGSKS